MLLLLCFQAFLQACSNDDPHHTHSSSDGFELHERKKKSNIFRSYLIAPVSTHEGAESVSLSIY